MATVGRDLKSVELTGRELWQDGPPYELFKEMRSGCPIHWTVPVPSTMNADGMPPRPAAFIQVLAIVPLAM